MPNKILTGKRAALDKNKTIIFATLAISAVVVVASLVIGRGIWSRANYLGKVSDKKEAALDQLKANKEALGTLKTSYQAFDSQNPNMLGGNPGATGGRDGSNSSIVLDALPSKYDFPALTASLEKILAGYNVSSITGTDDSLAQAAGGTEAVEIPFGIGVDTDYQGLKNVINILDKSIRPFQIVILDLKGNNSSLQAEITAKTYYQAEQGLVITEEVVQ